MKFLSVAMLSIVLFFQIGCSYTIPQSAMINEEYIANSNDFEVIGDVYGKSKIANILGFGFWKDRGYHTAYQKALKDAKKMGGDGLICIYSDKEFYSFFGLYNSTVTHVYAKAIKRKNLKFN